MSIGRACVLLMDSLGIGASLDAPRYGDEGSNTLGHIIEAALLGHADIEGVRQGPLYIPNLTRLGLLHALVASSAAPYVSLADLPPPQSLWGYAVEQSHGKDTPSGHWELMGVPVMYDWGYFEDKPQCFPKDLIDALIKEAHLPGVLGEKHASGTAIIDELGALHMRSGKPIVYTSADSVFQIAAHEETFGLERLYELCEIARKLVDPYQIGRVIARPFVGQEGSFRRSAHRRDYSTLPPAKTLFDFVKAEGREVIAIGKTADIFAHQGITQTIKADGNMALFEQTKNAMRDAPAGSLIFTNFVDFDSSYGHRRDIAGYAHALELFDAHIPSLEGLLGPEDCVVIAADHGCDPSREGSDHTREHIPVLLFGPHIAGGFIGRRESFADVGQSLASRLGIARLNHGLSFLS